MEPAWRICGLWLALAGFPLTVWESVLGKLWTLTMTREDFDALIRKLEEASRKNPRAYVARVLGLVILAYGYLGFLILLSVGIVAATFWLFAVVRAFAAIKIGIIVLVFAGGMIWAILRGVWVRFDAPEGLLVTRKDVPALFRLLDELREELQCTPFHHVLLVNDYNAAVIQLPRLGVFGWHRNYLLIGLPLMQSLGPDELKAVLAHEFAHSSGGHGRFGNWLYRLRRSWARIMDQMAKQQSGGAFLLVRFLDWYWPRFNAHAFVLARANEYEADACSVRLAGADAASRALMRLPVDGDLLSEAFWPKIYTLANTQKVPPDGILERMATSFREGVGEEHARRSLKQAFLLETNNGDTHPCLKDRLRAMGRLPEGVERGEVPPALPRAERSAAEEYLGDFARVAAAKLSEEWARTVERSWGERHEHAQKLAGELAEMEKPAEEPLTEKQLWQKAEKLMELHDDGAALPVIEQLLALNAHHVGANFVRGRQLLEKNDAAGIAFVEKAMASDPFITMEGCQLLYGYYVRTGQRDQLRPLENRVDQYQEEMAKAQQERADVSSADDFTPHALDEQTVQQVRKVFEGEWELGAAALVRKKTKHFPDQPFYVLVLKLDVAWWKPRGRDENQKVLDRIVEKVVLPGYFFAFVMEAQYKKVGKKIFAIGNSEVYRKEGRNR